MQSELVGTVGGVGGGVGLLGQVEKAEPECGYPEGQRPQDVVEVGKGQRQIGIDGVVGRWARLVVKGRPGSIQGVRDVRVDRSRLRFSGKRTVAHLRYTDF